MTASTKFPSYEVTRCPYDFYRAMQGCPVAPAGVGAEFVITRYEDVAEVLANNRIFSSASTRMENGEHRAATVEEARSTTVGPFVTLDPPVQSGRRRVARQILKADDIKSVKPVIDRTIDELIDEMEPRGHCEFISEFAERLPARVVLTLLGLPLADEKRAISWARYDGRGTRFHPRERQASIKGTLLDVADYMQAAVTDRYENPREDGLSRFVKAHVAELGMFDPVNAVADASLLLFGGVTTTAHMLGNTMNLVLGDAELRARILANPAMIPAVLNEGLRLESPVQWVDRLCLEDSEIGGVKIPAGSILLVLLGAANRDDKAFPDAEEFALSRRQVHVAFGRGVHTCIGAPLALAEGKFAFEKLFSRLPNLRHAENSETRPIGDTMLFRGLERLDLRFD